MPARIRGTTSALYLDLSLRRHEQVARRRRGALRALQRLRQHHDGQVLDALRAFPGYALRGAVSTGFRAPSLMQEFFSSTATNFVSGVPFDIKTFPASTPEAGALGASPLKAEKSTQLGFGLALEPLRGALAHGGLLPHRDRRSDRAVEQLHGRRGGRARSRRSASPESPAVATSPTPSTRARAATTSSPTTGSRSRRRGAAPVGGVQLESHAGHARGHVADQPLRPQDFAVRPRRAGTHRGGESGEQPHLSAGRTRARSSARTYACSATAR